MKYFEGIVEYERTFSKSRKKKKKANSINFIILFIKNNLLKVQFKNKHNHISDQFIYNPDKKLSFHIDNKEETITSCPLYFESKTSLKDYPLREIEDNFSCIGKKEVLIKKKEVRKTTEYFIEKIPLNINYSAQKILVQKSSSGTNAFLFSFGEHSTKSKNYSYYEKSKLTSLIYQEIESNTFEIPKGIIDKYRFRTEEDREKEFQLILDGFFEKDAEKILKLDYNRDLSKYEKKHSIYFLNQLFEEKPKLRRKIITEREEKQKAFEEKMRNRIIQVLESEWNRTLTQEEKKNPHDLFMKEIKQSSEKSLRLSNALLKLIN